MTKIQSNSNSVNLQLHNLHESGKEEQFKVTCKQELLPELPNSSSLDQKLSSYNYELPEERIAQNPAAPRDSARLLVIDSADTGKTTEPIHSVFHNLPSLLRPGDLLVMNNTRVIPARIYGQKPTGAPVEVLLLEEQQDNCWLALVKPGRRLKPGSKIIFDSHKVKGTGGAEGVGKWGSRGVGEKERDKGDKKDKEDISYQSTVNSQQSTVNSQQSPIRLTATVLSTDAATGGRVIQFDVPEGVSFAQLLEEYGQVPLPPYITDSIADSEQYQTVYAQRQGAIAAPTAGLHFTDELLQRLQAVGIEQAFITLHVGVGTFRPVEVEDITTHQMHSEWLEVPQITVEKIQAAKAKGGRIIAVGTTAVRALEGAAVSGQLQPYCGKTELFIYPGYQWRVVEGLITNFHLPCSSLLMLVSALIGRERLLNLYQIAIAQEYRFYSFGDAMLILPEARLAPNLA